MRHRSGDFLCLLTRRNDTFIQQEIARNEPTIALRIIRCMRFEKAIERVIDINAAKTHT